MMSNMRSWYSGSTGKFGRAMAAAVLVGIGALAGGCNNAAEGGLSGAGLGAGAGAIIGSLYGNAGTGAAIGAVAGGLSGAVIGDQNERRSRGGYYYNEPRSYGGGHGHYRGRYEYHYYERRCH